MPCYLPGRESPTSFGPVRNSPLIRVRTEPLFYSSLCCASLYSASRQPCKRRTDLAAIHGVLRPRFFQLIGFLAFGFSFRLLSLALQSVGQRAMRRRVVWIVVQCLLIALDGVGDLSLFHQRISRIGRHFRSLTVHLYALKFCAFFPFRRGLCSVSLFGEHGRECQVRIGLIGGLSNSLPQCIGRFR